jgi:hypothetical protein
MWWLFLCVGLATAGVLVLGALGLRAFTEVRRLSRQLAVATERLGRAAEDFQRAAEPLASRAGDLGRG